MSQDEALVTVVIKWLPASNWVDYEITTPSEMLGGGGEATDMEQALAMVAEAWSDAHDVTEN